MLMKEEGKEKRKKKKKRRKNAHMRLLYQVFDGKKAQRKNKNKNKNKNKSLVDKQYNKKLLNIYS